MSMKTIVRGLVVACCAALGLEAFAWTGTLTADTPQKVLDGTSLGDLDNMSFSGRIGGSYMGGSTGKVFEHFFLEDVVGEGADAYRLCQMQINDYNHATDCHLKFVTVKFTMGEDGIYAVQTEQGYVQNMGPQLVGTKIADGQGYTVNRSVTIAQYVLKSLEVVTEIKINDGETMTLTAENKPGADAIVYVNAGGTLDLHGIGDTDFTLILNGGTIKNTGNGISNGTKSLAKGIIVRADSTIDTSSNFGTIAGGHALHNINLGNHTLTKTGANTLFLSNVEFNGAGTIKIEQGMVRIYNSSTNQYPDNDHPGHSMASSGLVVDVKIASGAKLECYGAPKFHSITGVSNESKGELYLFGAEGLNGIPGCFDVSKVVLGGNKSTGYIGWNESAVELTINSTFEITQGSSSTAGTIKTLKGTGSITKTWDSTPIIYVEDHSGFTGSVAENIGVHLSIAKSETAYYYTIAQVKDAIATTDVTNISISDDDLAANGLKIVDGKIVAKTATELFLEGIAAGGEVALTDSITVGEWIVVDKAVTIDLVGHTITAAETFTGDAIIAIKHGGALTLKDSATGGTVDGSAVMCGIKMTQNASDTDTMAGDAVLVMQGGTVVGQNYGISGNGKRGGTSVTIEGGTVKAITEGDGVGIYQPQAGTLTITGGTVQGTTFGVYAKSGTLAISGGTIKSTATSIVDPSVNNNGTNGKGYALVLEKLAPGEGGYADNLTCDITGGTFEGVTAILSWARTSSIRLTKFVADEVVLIEGEQTPSAADIMKSYKEGPTSWDDVKEGDDVTTIITLPEGQTETAITATELKTWAEKTGATFGEAIPVNALIFNVAPEAVPEDPEAAAAEILKGLAVDVESLIKNGLSEEALAQLAETYPMAKFELVAVEALPDTDNAKFRKLKVDLK